jgi:hypothetical protein
MRQLRGEFTPVLKRIMPIAQPRFSGAAQSCAESVVAGETLACRWG